MNSQVLGNVMIGAGLAIIAGLALLKHRERRRDRADLRAEEAFRQAMWRERTQLFAWEEDAFDEIAARYHDAGLEILDRAEGDER